MITCMCGLYFHIQIQQGSPQVFQTGMVTVGRSKQKCDLLNKNNYIKEDIGTSGWCCSTQTFFRENPVYSKTHTKHSPHRNDRHCQQVDSADSQLYACVQRPQGASQGSKGSIYRLLS